MAFILETVVVTTDAAGTAHIAPYGLIADGDGWVLAPFRPSPAIANLAENPFAVASSPRDVRVIAGCVTGRRDWPTEPADHVPGRRLSSDHVHAHLELAVESVEEDVQRPRFRCRVVETVAVTAWPGYNRAQNAVLEAAILSTRLDMLPPEKIEREIAYLAIAIEKTAGRAEREAWGWIIDRIEAHNTRTHNNAAG
jgi:hypothetical protein